VSKPTKSSTYIGRVQLSCVGNATSHGEDGGEAASKARRVFSTSIAFNLGKHRKVVLALSERGGTAESAFGHRSSNIWTKEDSSRILHFGQIHPTQQQHLVQYSTEKFLYPLNEFKSNQKALPFLSTGWPNFTIPKQPEGPFQTLKPHEEERLPWGWSHIAASYAATTAREHTPPANQSSKKTSLQSLLVISSKETSRQMKILDLWKKNKKTNKFCHMYQGFQSRSIWGTSHYLRKTTGRTQAFRKVSELINN